MKKGVIANLYNTNLQEAGNNADKAGKLTADKLEDLMRTEKIQPKDFNFAQMAHELIPNLEELRNAPIQDLANEVRSSQFPTISKVVIHSEIIKAYQVYQESIDDLITEGEATRTTEETIAGFTEQESLEMRLEGMSYEETNFGEKDVKVYMADFGRMIRITREVLYNDRTGQLLANARKLGDKAGQHRAKIVMQTLECLPRTAFKEPTGGSKAFVYKGTAYQVASFYSADHSAIDNKVNANIVTTNALADYTDVQAALLKYDSMVDSQGDPITLGATHLIVPPALSVIAWQIMGGASYYPVGPTTAGLTVGTNLIPVHNQNPYGPGGLGRFKLVISRFMSSASTWYIGSPREQLIWLWVYRPSTQALAASNETAFTNNIILTYKFSYHGGCGNSDYAHIVKNTQ